MNRRVSKLINTLVHSSMGRHDMKALWNSTPRNERHKLHMELQEKLDQREGRLVDASIKVLELKEKLGKRDGK